MTDAAQELEAKSEELKPFFTKLRKKHTVAKTTSRTAKQLEVHEELKQYAHGVATLQAFSAAEDHNGYESTRDALKEEIKRREDGDETLKTKGLTFRQTHGQVYLDAYEGETVDVEVAVQVKGNSLTWYFWAEGAMDQYPQEFRDRLYLQAAESHKSVNDGCDLYYRGSNSYHIKNMHHIISEAGHNHNHYRLANDKHYTPDDFNQHLSAFKGSSIETEFFQPGEIDDIIQQFNEFHQDWTAKVGDEKSKEERYFSQLSQRYNRGDMIELRLFGTMQEPCRLNVGELKVDYDAARAEIDAAIKSGEDPARMAMVLKKVTSQYEALLAFRDDGGTRGIGSSKASTRQPEGSGLKTQKEQVMDDALGHKVPAIPSWAKKAREAVRTARQAMISHAEENAIETVPEDDVALQWEGQKAVVIQKFFKEHVQRYRRSDQAPEQGPDQEPDQAPDVNTDNDTGYKL